jgi:hypothetical protein
MVHDFNNLLGIITLNLELARERAATGGEVHKMIEEALDAAWQGAELTSRLADPPPRLQTQRKPIGTRQAGGSVPVPVRETLSPAPQTRDGD